MTDDFIKTYWLSEKLCDDGIQLFKDNIRLAAPGKIGYGESNFVDHSTKQSMDMQCVPKFSLNTLSNTLMSCCLCETIY